MRTKEELMNLRLPKWPQCIITGTSISTEDALEIIRRTDRALDGEPCGNNKEWNNMLISNYHMPELYRLRDNESCDIDKYYVEIEEWREKWGWINLQYLSNDWINCCTFGGAQGWMHPDGIIGYFYNIGKYPEVEEVFEDLQQIVTAFPFLELECTLMNHEYCDNESDNMPVVSFLVRNQTVELVDPLERNIHEEFNRNVPTYEELEKNQTSIADLLSYGFDCKIPEDVIASWSKFAP